MRLPIIVYGIVLCPVLSFAQTTAPASTNLPGASPTNANLPGASLSSVNLPGANLSSAGPSAANSATISKLDNTYAGMNAAVNTSSLRLLRQMQKKENALHSILLSKDSTTTTQLFAGSAALYQQMETRLQTGLSNPVTTVRNYIPGIDSMQTAIRFLSGSGLPIEKIQQLQALSTRLTQLQGSLQNAGELQTFVTQRIALLQGQLNQYGLTSRLAGLDKTAFYYQQQLSQYKNILNDRQRQQQLILIAVRQLPAFQHFWQQNSMLAQLFPAPGNSGTLLSGNGLQTSAQVGKIIQNKLGARIDDGGNNAAQYLQQQVGGAQGQVDQLKNQLNRLNVAGGSSDMTLPDFTPNSQRQKSFFRRLELGFNLQNSAATSLLPAISTLGLSLGYRLSDKAIVGVGVSYLMGLGDGFNHIRLSNQGAGLRSFIDIKGFKTIWITGGMEYNYMQQFASIKNIQNLDLWQKSLLAGLTKKFNIGKHSGNIQLLYDFLASSEVPRGQPLNFRFGFGL